MNAGLSRAEKAVLSGQKLTSQAIGTGLEGGKGVLAEVGRGSEVVDRVLQKELVRKAGSSAGHKAHVMIENLIETAKSLPPAWRAVWLLGTIVIIVMGFTILIMVPCAFTVPLAVWTWLIVAAAERCGGEQREEKEGSRGNSTFTNPMADIDMIVVSEEEEEEEEEGGEDGDEYGED